MLVERAELTIRAGMEQEFATAMSERGLPLLLAVAGVKRARLGRGVEHPEKFMLLVEWASMDAHQAFPTAPNYAPFRAVIRPYSIGGAMEHFQFD
jgi:heme-degrading monooxygenase HmoA